MGPVTRGESVTLQDTGAPSFDIECKSLSALSDCSMCWPLPTRSSGRPSWRSGLVFTEAPFIDCSRSWKNIVLSEGIHSENTISGTQAF